MHSAMENTLLVYDRHANLTETIDLEGWRLSQQVILLHSALVQ